MKLFGYLICFVFAFSVVSAGTVICIDLDAPSAPGNLRVSGSVGSILLEWDAASDEPSCSGIAEYVVSREGVGVGVVNGSVLSFVDVDSLGEGEYVYAVHAIDRVGHNAGASIANKIEVYRGGGSGSSSGSYICAENWECGNWTDCIGKDMRRPCEDLNKCGTERYRPEVYQECGLTSQGNDSVSFEDEEPENGVGNKFFSAITGAVSGVAGTPQGIAASAFVMLALCGFIIIKIRKKKK